MVLEDWVRKRPLVRTRRYTCVGVGIGACVCKITENRSWRFRTVIHCSDYGRSCAASQEPGSAFSRDSPLLVAPRARQKWVGAAASLCPKSSSTSTARFVAVPNCFWSSW